MGFEATEHAARSTYANIVSRELRELVTFLSAHLCADGALFLPTWPKGERAGSDCFATPGVHPNSSTKITMILPL